MSALTDKIEDLITYINKGDEEPEEKKESITYLEHAPQPQPSTVDIDTSKIKIVVLGCGLVVPPLIEVNIPCINV